MRDLQLQSELFCLSFTCGMFFWCLIIINVTKFHSEIVAKKYRCRKFCMSHNLKVKETVRCGSVVENGVLREVE